MHLVKDENGNLVSHGHDHDHDHGHDHCHEGHTHEGCGSCESDCHSHSHSHEAPETNDQMIALLDYMLKHNEHHAAELDQMAAKLQAAGKTAAAEQIKKAVDEFQKGNLYLSLALSTVKEAR